MIIAPPEQKSRIAVTNPPYTGLLYALCGLAGSTASILTIIAGLFAIWRIHIRKNIERARMHGLPILWVAVIGYYVAGAVSAAMYPGDAESVSQLIERLPFLLLPPLVELMSRSDGGKLLNHAVSGAALGSVISALYVVVSDWPDLHFNRAEAMSGNANVLGYMCALLVIVTCLGLAIAPHKKVRAACLAGALIAIVLVVMSGSRGALLGTVGTCVLMAWMAVPWRSSVQKFSIFALGLMLAGILIAVSPLASRFMAIYQDLTATTIDFSGTNAARLAMWTCGWSTGWDSPLLGPGHDAALASMQACTLERFDVALGYSHFHNVFLDQFAKGGILGLASVVLLLAMPLLMLFIWHRKGVLPQDVRTRKAFSAAVVSLFVTQLAAGMFNIGFGHDAIDAGFIFTFAVLFGLIASFYTEQSRQS